MKYYLYVSDTKVDMLYSQIPDRERHTIATELKIDLKLLSATFKETPPAETRYSRLQVVCDYIRRQDSIGSIHDTKPYFEGKLMMSWGPVVNGYGSEGRGKVRSAVIFFAGRQGRTILGLGGSSRHVIGSVAGEGPDLQSALPFLVDALVEAGDFKGYVDERWLDDVLTITKVKDIKEPMALSLVNSVSSQLMQTRPPQRLEFVARRLLTGTPLRRPGDSSEADAELRVVLGSPVYVAIAD